MEEERAKDILLDMVEKGYIDNEIVNVLIKNFSRINSLREYVQKEASKEYEEFFSQISNI